MCKIDVQNRSSKMYENEQTRVRTFFYCSLLKMTKICFGSTILENFNEESEKGHQILLPAPGTRNPLNFNL